MSNDSSFLPKIKNSLARTGRSLQGTTLREISRTCVSPVSPPEKQSALKQRFARKQRRSLALEGSHDSADKMLTPRGMTDSN